MALSSGAAVRTPRSPTLFLLLALFGWCGGRAAMDLEVYGVETLRDSVIWSYGIFSLILASLLASRPERLRWLLGQYRRFTGIFVLVVPAVWLVANTYGEALPRIPGTVIPILQPKSTDLLVHLAGIASFQLVGLGAASWLSMATIGIGFVVLSTRSRGAMLGFVAAVALAAFLRPLNKRLWRSVALVVAAIPLLVSVDFGVAIEGRELSARQAITNALSVFQRDRSWRLDGTKQWRLDWWSEIVEYTIDGPHFWLGKGFGVNLAESDGFTLGLEVPLRSPHSCHMTMLARAGVPGLVLWVLVQASWALEMVRRYRASRRARQRRWAELFLFLLAYWLAFLVNASFDVALEGPMAGIWFWSVFGVGLAASRIHLRRPDVLEPPVSPTGAAWVGSRP